LSVNVSEVFNANNPSQFLLNVGIHAILTQGFHLKLTRLF
jgi:hypothetical protein